MRYIITDKHPFMKESLVFEKTIHIVDYGYRLYDIGKEDIILGDGIHDEWLKDGWIKTIDE